MPEPDLFADVLTANEEFASRYAGSTMPGVAAKGLAVLTCMDSRLDPLGMLGLAPGVAKILRNAGARVTEDVLRTLVLAAYLLNVSRVMIVAQTRCRMAGATESDVHTAVEAAGGPDSRSLSFLTALDQEAALVEDVQRVRSWPYLRDVEVGGFVYDVGHRAVPPALLTRRVESTTANGHSAWASAATRSLSPTRPESAHSSSANQPTRASSPTPAARDIRGRRSARAAGRGASSGHTASDRKAVPAARP